MGTVGMPPNSSELSGSLALVTTLRPLEFHSRMLEFSS